MERWGAEWDPGAGGGSSSECQSAPILLDCVTMLPQPEQNTVDMMLTDAETRGLEPRYGAAFLLKQSHFQLLVNVLNTGILEL